MVFFAQGQLGYKNLGLVLGLKTQRIGIDTFNPVQVALYHHGIAATQLLGNRCCTTRLDRNGSTVRDTDCRTIPADQHIMSFK